MGALEKVGGPNAVFRGVRERKRKHCQKIVLVSHPGFSFGGRFSVSPNLFLLTSVLPFGLMVWGSWGQLSGRAPRIPGSCCLTRPKLSPWYRQENESLHPLKGKAHDGHQRHQLKSSYLDPRMVDTCSFAVPGFCNTLEFL